MKENTTILYFDKKGKPCKQDDAVLCIIQEKDARGKIIRETEVPITDEN